MITLNIDMSDLYFIQNSVRRKAKEISCEFCRTSFLTRLNSNSKFCSRECSRNSLKKESEISCQECQKIFKRNTYKVENASKHNVHFCSRQCKDKAQSLKGSCPEIRPKHYGMGNGINSYRDLAFENFKIECNKCGYNKFLEVLQVHHKDKNRENNVLDNLEILCPTCHSEIHFLDRSGVWSKGDAALVG